MTPGAEALQYRAILEDALSFDPENPSFEAVVEGIEAGKFQLWPGSRSVAVTELVRHPSGLTCHIWLAAGDLTELSAMYPACEAWAKSVGCTRMSLVGRPGWERTWMRSEGFRPRSITLDKSLWAPDPAPPSSRPSSRPRPSS